MNIIQTKNIATCKLFLQKRYFSSKTSFGLLIFRKIFNVNYRKEKDTTMKLCLYKKIYMNRFINFLATCKLFLQKKIEGTQNEHEF